MVNTKTMAARSEYYEMFGAQAIAAAIRLRKSAAWMREAVANERQSRQRCQAIREQTVKPNPNLTDAKTSREAREDARVTSAKTLLNHPALRFQPHPNELRAKHGASLADYCRWMLDQAGRSGKLKALRMLEKAIACHQED